MKRDKMLHLNDSSLYQLARAVSETPKDMQYTKSRIQEACAWIENFVGQADAKMFKHSLKESIQVAILATTEMSLGLSTVIAAILGPSFLEGLVPKKNIQKRFGLKIVSILMELNSLKHSKWHRIGMVNGGNALGLSTPAVLAILLQICDIIHVSYSGVPLESLHSALLYHSSSRLLFDLKYFYIPLAHRLRLYDIQAKLADFWLKHTDTLSYYSITAKIGMTKLQRAQKLYLISEEVHSAVEAHGINCVLKKRMKSIYSIWHKMHRLKVDFDQIHDLTAIRIILTGMDDKTRQEEKIACWRVLSIVSHLYNPICNIMRDWISIPKESSYESLHLTFETYKYGRLEIQIRTKRMDHIAEHGAAAHWQYKKLDLLSD